MSSMRRARHELQRTGAFSHIDGRTVAPHRHAHTTSVDVVTSDIRSRKGRAPQAMIFPGTLEHFIKR